MDQKNLRHYKRILAKANKVRDAIYDSLYKLELARELTIELNKDMVRFPEKQLGENALEIGIELRRRLEEAIALIEKYQIIDEVIDDAILDVDEYLPD